MFSQPGVELETGGIAEIRERSIVTEDGREIEADAIIFGTGFHVTDADGQRAPRRPGRAEISDAWRDGVTAHLGTTVAGFPNLFLLVGPNTGLGHNSIIFMIEAQVRYIMSCLRLVARSGARAIEVRPQAQRALQRLGAGKVQRLGLAAGRLRQLVPRLRGSQPRALAGLHGELLAAHAPGQARRLPARGGAVMTAVIDAGTGVIRCRDGNHTIALTDRELTAERLIKTSRKHSFDPDVDVDWDARPAPGLFYAPPELVSLYETPLWDRLSDEQRIELTKHETASLASFGIWSELLLMQILVQHSYRSRFDSSHVGYALTEIADECRHSIMFGRMVRTLGLRTHRPRPLEFHALKVLGAIYDPMLMFAAVLVIEEFTDSVQRATFPDERIQPLVRQVAGST